MHERMAEASERPKSGKQIELKVRVPRPLMERINRYRHEQRLDSKKEAIVELLIFALENKGVAEADD
jgi:hypothetical protein